MSASIIGIDLGGTEVKSVAVSYPDGNTIAQETLPTCDGEFLADGKPVFARQVAELIRSHENTIGHSAACVGLSAPGLATPEGDAIAFMPGRMAGLEKLHWQETLGRIEALPVLNDAHAALMGEIWLGAARGLQDVIMYTLGTGVGGAIVSGGNLLKGRFGRAGHLGHTSVDYRGEPDLCRTPGSIEDAIGELTLPKRSENRFTSTEALVDSYTQGDPEATEIWLDSLRALAAAIVSMSNAVDPEVVVLGGGITEAGDALFTPLTKFVKATEWLPADACITLRKAELGTWAGAYGAAYQAAQKLFN
ncbi:ROK family protein [bacterium]|nr:ROK family protein [bacterium]